MHDDQLLSLLRGALADTPPGDAVEAAYAAYEFRDLDTQLARLVEDARVEVVGFGDSAPSRCLTYEAGGGTVRISIDVHALQMAASPRPDRVLLQRPDVAVELVPDEEGVVHLLDVSGPLRFDVRWSNHVARTSWITL